MTPTADLMRLVEKWREVDAPAWRAKGTGAAVEVANAYDLCANQLTAALSSTGDARVGGEKPVVHVGSIGHMDSGKRNLAAALTALATPAQPKASEGKAGGEDAARIDWLEATARDKYAVTIGEVLQKGCRCLSCWEYGVMDEDEKLGRGETVRAAIDAAMTATLTAPGADDGQ